jgi:Putative Flp pilus-assembly TadE/G-like
MFRKLKSQRGVIIPIFSILVIIFLMFLGLVVGGGSLFLNKSRLNKVANLAAMSAIESYMATEDINDTLTSQQLISNKIAAARDSANFIVKSHDFLLSNKKIKSLAVYDGSAYVNEPTMHFGVWFDDEPNNCQLSSGCSCDEVNGKTPSKPCFKTVPASNISAQNIDINAVKIELITPDDAWYAPFSGIFGQSLFGSSTTSTVKSNERCTIFAVDISSSSFADSHEYMGSYTTIGNSPDGSRLSMTNPTGNVKGQLGNYAIGVPNENYPPYPWKNSSMEFDCSKPVPPIQTGFDYNVTREFLNYAYWCHLLIDRPASCSNGELIPGVCDWHYRSDYQRTLTPEGEYNIDLFRNPEPISSIYLAINAGLRALKSRLTAVDKIALIPFAGDEINPVPAEGLTKKLDFMIDMTDVRRAGKRVYKPTGWITENVQHPNFIDRGWFPMEDGTKITTSGPRSGTNITKVLDKSIKRLTDSNYCSTSAKKTIVLASDGLFTQYHKTTAGPVNWEVPLPMTRWNNMLEAEDLLFRNPSLEDNILKRLIEAKISLVSILVGDMVEPNFINIRRSGTTDQFLSISELGASGFRGMPDAQASPPEYAMSDTSVAPPAWIPPQLKTVGRPCSPGSYNNNECALRTLINGIPGVKFRRANGVFSQLSILSSGLFCPISEPYRSGSNIDANCYDKNKLWKSGSSNCSRTELSPQTISVYGDEMGGQAANCVQKVINATPYVLAESEVP